MTLDRRQVLTGTVSAGTGLLAGQSIAPAQAQKLNLHAQVDMSQFGVQPNIRSDQTRLIQKAIDNTAQKGQILFIPGGTYTTGQLKLPSNACIIGAPGQSRFIYNGNGAFLSAENKENITLSALIFDGAAKPLAQTGSIDGLLDFRAIKNITVENCRIEHSVQNGLSMRNCSGRVQHNQIQNIALSALFAQENDGVEISHNRISNCGNNGIQVWRQNPGADNTLIIANRIEKIAAKNGGSGQNGNGINIFRADNVIVSQNHITDCAFSAIRGNSASNLQILSNQCHQLGEVALYAEFGFEGAIVSNNLVDGAQTGISITNFKEGGRLAVVQGNIVRNIKKKDKTRGIGIFVEADSAVSGNVVENAESFGLMLGWGEYLRDINASNNIIRNCAIGIGISADPKAGFATVIANMISGAKKGAIRALDFEKPIGPDLAKESSESFRNFAVFGNVSPK